MDSRENRLYEKGVCLEECVEACSQEVKVRQPWDQAEGQAELGSSSNRGFSHSSRVALELGGLAGWSQIKTSRQALPRQQLVIGCGAYYSW